MKQNKKQKAFYVILHDFNAKKFIKYDIMPHLLQCYNDAKKDKRPKTFEEFKKFIEREGKYQWQYRCEYEIILSDWPQSGQEEKWDVYRQLEMNLELIAELLMQNCNADI